MNLDNHHNYHVFTKLLSTLLLLSLTTLPAQAETKIRMVESSGSIETYAKGLLRLAFSKMPEKRYVIEDNAPNVSEERVVSMLQDNQIDIVWYASDKDLEERMLPIRIPMYRGLLGYRVLMIKKGNQSKFNGIKTQEDLQRVTLGQGRFWADTAVLTSNNLKVVKVLKYESLFYMLDGDRFDAFPRGAHEPWSEMKRYPNLALEVEQNLLLSYTNPFYFFVNKNNTQLARDIEQALRIAIDDGSFNEYFLQDPTVKDVIEKANLRQRTIIRLDNPTLPPKTPVNDPSLWLDPYSLE